MAAAHQGRPHAVRAVRLPDSRAHRHGAGEPPRAGLRGGAASRFRAAISGAVQDPFNQIGPLRRGTRTVTIRPALTALRLRHLAPRGVECRRAHRTVPRDQADLRDGRR
ncbi:hypothetical protein FRAHR75_190007 [Frankia sp. Hr75.2]|nr:hypothetical protein FRAHR75_190007 [Frankia sp. Hr75.2]